MSINSGETSESTTARFYHDGIPCQNEAEWWALHIMKMLYMGASAYNQDQRVVVGNVLHILHADGSATQIEVTHTPPRKSDS